MKTTQIEIMERQVARPLKVLVPLINQDIHDGDKAAAQAGAPFYRAAGEKLIEAKASGKNSGEVKHGGFERWAEKTFKRSQQTLNEWMRFAKKTKGLPPKSFEGRGMTSFTRSPAQNEERKAQRHVWEEVKKANPERMARIAAEEKRSKASEAEVQENRAKLGRELAHKLIKIGYRALATQLHPDKGNNGSQEAMSLLNDVASYLRRWADDYQG
jgi:hypothetical protein